MRYGFGLWVAVGLTMVAAAGLWQAPVDAQRGGMFMGSPDDPAIAYSTAPLSNVIDDLNKRLEAGSATLRFEGRSGYLQSMLDALELPIDSQLLVFSQASLQGRLIGPANPRAIFFNDRVFLAWVRDGDVLEAIAHDEREGAVFYTLVQRPGGRPAFEREFRCLACHMNGDTSGVPGLLMFSTTRDADGKNPRLVTTDHRSPIADRWGGWFVTASRAAANRGNQIPALETKPAAGLASVAGLLDTDGYRGATSDIAALLAFSHQTEMVNLLTRASWEARASDPALHPQAPGDVALVEAAMRSVANEVVDYMLFIDEAPLPNPVAGGSGFTARMSALGPRDRRGRSLYELDLNTRLLKYPCSYLVYSPAFDALPPLAKAPIYRRLWQVLSGEVSEPRYRVLSLEDRRAVVEILRDTKPDLPAYFTTVTK
jgi:heme-degrading monooxygenase HmoA